MVNAIPSTIVPHIVIVSCLVHFVCTTTISVYLYNLLSPLPASLAGNEQLYKNTKVTTTLQQQYQKNPATS